MDIIADEQRQARDVSGMPDKRDGISAKQDPFLRRARLKLNTRLPLAFSVPSIALKTQTK